MPCPSRPGRQHQATGAIAAPHIAGRVRRDMFTNPWAYLTFHRVLCAEIEASGAAELVMLESRLDGERDQIWRDLIEPAGWVSQAWLGAETSGGSLLRSPRTSFFTRPRIRPTTAQAMILII